MCKKLSLFVIIYLEEIDMSKQYLRRYPVWYRKMWFAYNDKIVYVGVAAILVFVWLWLGDKPR